VGDRQPFEAGGAVDRPGHLRTDRREDLLTPRVPKLLDRGEDGLEVPGPDRALVLRHLVTLSEIGNFRSAAPTRDAARR
jgi:hypothetical protein